jgi:hypothetical protein
MQDIFTSIKAYLYDRAVSPLIGAFVVAWSVWNYRFFVVLFAGGLPTPADKFKAIDLLFKSYTIALGDVNVVVSGKIIDGFIAPAVIGILYLYAYPFLAKPVYEHSLKKQKELRAVRQEQEDNRLLSVEESRELFRRLAQMQSKHEGEVDSLNNQVSALSRHLDELNNRSSGNQEMPPSNLASAPENSMNEDATEYDEFIREALATQRNLNTFFLNELFGQEKWSEIPLEARQALEKRFRHQVERGDFVGIKLNGKSNGKIQNYYKTR